MMTVINEGGHCMIRMQTQTSVLSFFVLLFSNLLEDFGSYQFCGIMLWQVGASVLSSYWLYVITYTFMMLVSCK